MSGERVIHLPKNSRQDGFLRGFALPFDRDLTGHIDTFFL